MTRKDYEMIAANIRAELDTASTIDEVPCAHHDGMVRQGGLVDGHRQAARSIACSIASALEAENPRFDRERFMRACGL